MLDLFFGLGKLIQTIVLVALAAGGAFVVLRVVPREHRGKALVALGVAALVVLVYLWLRSRPFAGPGFAFHEGNAGTQDEICTLGPQPGQRINLQNAACPNDEARSVILLQVKAGTVLRVYDSPEGALEDDWTEIVLTADVEREIVPSFDAPLVNEKLRVVPHGNNGLDGKVSLIEVADRPAPPMVALYEGNGASQNKVCELGAGGTGAINFQNHDQCDNDEARSAVLFDVPAGRIVRFFDSPDGSRQDDWAEVFVKRAAGRIQIDSFERSFENADVRVVYHRNNGLDGKVSRLEVGAEPTRALVELYESNDARQNLICSLSADRDLAVDFTNHPCANDEARSLKLYNVPAGRVIRLFDSPSGAREDDWVEIEALRDIAERTVPTFERSSADATLRVSYFRNNGLDGKVSRFEAGGRSEVAGIVSFYEGNNGSQNKVCDVSTTFRGRKNFKDDAQCDNDEARSLVLTNVRAGFVIRVFDSPSCATDDDWTEIRVRQDIARHVVGTFERSQGDAAVQVTFHRDNGLDGKVSCIAVP